MGFQSHDSSGWRHHSCCLFVCFAMIAFLPFPHALPPPLNVFSPLEQLLTPLFLTVRQPLFSR